MDIEKEEGEMDFIVNQNEMAGLCGLTHIQQLVYFRGIKPYMNVKTGIVGIDRGISYQSIAEQLYIEPHQGIKSVSFSRAQVRRAVAGLERAGLIQFLSEDHTLILKCILATRDYYVSKKAVTKPSQQGITKKSQKDIENTGNLANATLKAGIAESAKADIPLINNNYLYLFKQFEKFWSRFPNKKSKQKAWSEFQQINPDEQLFEKIIIAIDAQINNREEHKLSGEWLPPWKYPANWLAQHCWKDELSTVMTQEQSNAKNKRSNAKKSPSEIFWDTCGDAEFDFADETPKQSTPSNVLNFSKD
ncbi:hypothetical protein [Legionella drancourtii]|uniref:Legionella vir region protein n=2 Tax=Legionella drancourtii TaxID=168933 RepID=G9ENH6_9GAMM|nr:hypothetical protein [Legionella drancourtii]EHL31337.1 hypothetical protein LDG_6799 [Legionella drancourtii LLAP12]